MELQVAYESIKNVGIIIVSIYGAMKLLDGAMDLWKKHSIKDAMHLELESAKEALNSELSKCKEDLDLHKKLLDNDNKRLNTIEDDMSLMKSDFIEIQMQSDKQFEIMVKTMLALVSYSLDNSNKEDLKKAQQELLTYLATK